MVTKLPTHNIHKQHPHGAAPVGSVPTGAAPDIVDTLVDGANNATNKAIIVTQFSTFIVSLLAGIAGATKWLANKFDITSIAKAGDTAQKGLKGFPKKSFSEVFGGSKIIDKTAHSLGDGLNRVVDSTGLSGVITKIRENRGWLHLREIDKLSNNLNASAALPSGLREHIQEIGNLAKAGNTDHHEVTEALSKFADIIEKESKNLSKKDAKALGKLGKAVDNHFASINFRKIGDVVKAVPKAIGNAPVLHGVMNATLIGASAVGVLAEANGFRKNLASLKQMSAEITGKPVSTFSLLFGKVPAPVAEARSKLIKNFAVSEVSGVAALGATVLNAVKKNGVGLVGFIAPQLIGSGVSMLIGESSLPLYTKLSQAHASGQQILAVDYAELVGKASPELQARGATASVFSKELGKQYATEKTTPAQIMREISNGDLMKRVHALIAKNELAKPMLAATVTDKKISKSHVAALEKKGQPDKNHTVVGDHTKKYTEKLVANAGQAKNALGGA